MSVQSEIDRITENVANTYSALSEMGATMPAQQNSNNMASTVLTVPRGGGGSVQSDWNQNDTSAADFIKNKPFYAEDPVVTTETLFSEKTIDGFAHGNCEVSTYVDVTDGDEVVVVWDGVEYSTIAQEVSAEGVTGIFFGNYALLGLDENVEDNGMPFVIVYINDQLMFAISTSDTESTEHTVGITKVITTQKINQLDEKYINADWMAQKTVTPVEAFSETTATLSPDGVVDPNWSFDLETLNNAEYVDVIWNGETYRCVPKNVAEFFMIGNIALFDPTCVASSEPFLFIYFMATMFVLTPEEVQATFSIIAYIGVPVSTMPMEYLPDMLQFGYEYEVESVTDVITWDGQKNNDVVSPWGDQYAYVSNAVPSFAECCNGGIIEITDSTGVHQHSFDSSDVVSQNDLMIIVGNYIVILTDAAKSVGYTPGIYFLKSGQFFVSGFRINYYSFVETVKKIKTIDPKYLPEDIGSGSGLPEVTAENNGAFLRVVDGAWSIVNLPSVEDGEF